MGKRINPIVAFGRRARKAKIAREKAEAKRLARFRKMEIKARRREQKEIAKEVARIRKKEGLYG